MRASLAALLFSVALALTGCMTVGEGFGPDSDPLPDDSADGTGGDGGGDGAGDGGGNGDGSGGGNGGGNGGGDGGGDGDPGGPTPATIMADFGACMTPADFEAAGLGALALAESAGGACNGCHGVANQLSPPTLDVDAALTFAATQVSPSVSRWVEVGPDLIPAFNPVLVNHGQGGGHVAYTLDIALEEGLQQFYLATEQRYLAGECP